MASMAPAKLVKAMLTNALASFISATAADAQLSAIPRELLTTVQALGPVLNDEVRGSARDLYAPLHPKLGPEKFVRTDLAYGPDERQKLDLLAPATKPATPVPVIIYVHGGMYVRGDKTEYQGRHFFRTLPHCGPAAA